MDPDHGLTHKLLACDLLSYEEMTEVSCYRSYFDQNDRIIMFLIRSSDIPSELRCEQFLTALGETYQCHVINYLLYDGGKFFCTRFIGKYLVLLY